MKNYAIFDVAHLGAALELERSGTVLNVNDVVDINRTALALQPQSTGRWYAELLVYGVGTLEASIGIATLDAGLATYVGGDANGWGYRLADGAIHNNGASVAAVAAAAKGDIIGVLLDLTSNVPKVSWYKQGLIVAAQTLPSNGPWILAASLGGSEAYGLRCFLNGGQRAFEYALDGVDGWYTPGDAITGLRVASDDWLSAATDDAPHQRYGGLLDGPGNEMRAVRSLDFWPWQRGVKTGALVVSVINGDDALADLLSQDARDTPVRISCITPGETYAERTPLFSAVVDNVTAQNDLLVTLTCRDPLALLDVPLQRRLIRPDADPASANQPWPILLGACRNVPCVSLDATTYTYAASDTPLLGIGFVRDSGYPYDPQAVPPDFTLSTNKLTITTHAQPLGVVTMDASSVGGQQLPQPSDDIYGGAGAPFTGDYGSAPTGWDDTGAEVTGAEPVMGVDGLEFPLVKASSTVYAKMPAYTSGVSGSVALRLEWLSASGLVIRTRLSPTLTGTNPWTDLELIDSAPREAVAARLQAVTFDHVAGIVRVGAIAPSYVRWGDRVAVGNLVNADFSAGDLSGWEASKAGWSYDSTSSIDGQTVTKNVAFCTAPNQGSQLANTGTAPVTEPGKRITAWCDAALYKGSDDWHPFAQVGLFWYNAAGKLLSWDLSPGLTKGNKGYFSKLTTSGISPAGVDYVKYVLMGGMLDSHTDVGHGSRFANCGWDYVLEPSAGGTRTAISVGDFTNADLWQLGQGWTLYPPGANGPSGAAYAEHAPYTP